MNLLYSGVKYSSIASLYFKPRMSGSQCKNSSDMAGIVKKLQLLNNTTVLFKVPYCKIKSVFLGFLRWPRG